MPKRTYPSGDPAIGAFGGKAATYFNNRNNALKDMLSDIWGEEGITTGQSLFRTEDGKALGAQIVEAYDKNASGITQKRVNDHMAVAGFFEKNPAGKLLIMMKDDNEPHVLSYDQDKHKYTISEEAFKPKPLPQKPSPWDRFLGFFGNKKAKEKVNTYDTAAKDRKWYDSFKKQGSDLTKTIEKKQQQKLKQYKVVAEETSQVLTTEKQNNMQKETFLVKESIVKRPENPFETNDSLLKEAYNNLQKEMTEKPNLAKIDPETHTNTKEALAEEANRKFSFDQKSYTTSKFIMNVARQLVITMAGDAKEVQGASIDNSTLNGAVSGICRTKEFNDVINQINVRDEEGDIIFSARQEKIKELVKDGGKSLISDGLRKQFDRCSSLRISRDAPTKTMAKSKTNDKVMPSKNQNSPTIGGRC